MSGAGGLKSVSDFGADAVVSVPICGVARDPQGGLYLVMVLDRTAFAHRLTDEARRKLVEALYLNEGPIIVPR